ncbi:MAG: type II toxin-antitoxin system VapC family toxin [Solirubrobacterales bacterium]
MDQRSARRGTRGTAALIYLDSSALVKLVIPEPESDALADALRGRPELASSELAAVEVPRSASRSSDDPAAATRAESVLEGIDLIALDPEMAAAARDLRPMELRSLDAIHIATALALGGELETFISFDRRQIDGATGAGLDVASPGA